MVIPKAVKTTTKELERVDWFRFLQSQFMYDDLYGKVDKLPRKKRRWRLEYAKWHNNSNYNTPKQPTDTVEYNASIILNKREIRKRYSSINSKSLLYLKKVLATFENSSMFTVYHAKDNSQIKLVCDNNVTHIKL